MFGNPLAGMMGSDSDSDSSSDDNVLTQGMKKKKGGGGDDSSDSENDDDKDSGTVAGEGGGGGALDDHEREKLSRLERKCKTLNAQLDRALFKNEGLKERVEKLEVCSYTQVHAHV